MPVKYKVTNKNLNAKITLHKNCLDELEQYFQAHSKQEC